VARVGISVSILLAAAGAILLWAVNREAGGVDLDTIGVIVLVVGAIGAVLSLVFLSSWGGSPRRPGDRERVYVDR
jgi:hypothetical protein